MNKYILEYQFSFDKFILNFKINKIFTTEAEAEDFDRYMPSIVEIKDDILYIHSPEYDEEILSVNRGQYYFEACTKDLPPPIDSKKLSKQDILDLLHDEKYMTNPEAYEKIDITLAEFYENYQLLYPEKSGGFCTFENSSYAIKEFIERD